LELEIKYFSLLVVVLSSVSFSVCWSCNVLVFIILGWYVSSDFVGSGVGYVDISGCVCGCRFESGCVIWIAVCVSYWMVLWVLSSLRMACVILVVVGVR
jgi:hypothetical protein